MNPLPDRSNYSPLSHTHYLTPGSILHSFFRPDPLPSRELETNTLKFTAAALYCRSSRELSALRKLNNKQRQVSMFLLKFLIHFPFVSFLSISILSLLPFSILSLLPLPHPFFLFCSILCLDKDFKFHYILFHQWHIFFCILFHTMTYFF